MQKPRHHSSWFNSLCLDYLRQTYDIIIVDTPPSLSTINSVFCLCLKENDQIIIPVCPEGFSIMGVDMFLDDILENCVRCVLVLRATLDLLLFSISPFTLTKVESLPFF